jgi:coenzyme F420-0:L-glutamate ligase / coenzyme F420-1:gamma-L-glutamate ligase
VTALSGPPHGVQPLAVLPLTGLPEIRSGDDLAALIATAAPDLRDGDILVVTSKIVSKAEGRSVIAADRESAIDSELIRVVAQRGPTRIVETRHGLVLAAAGVDASNTPTGTVLLLPEDSDASARRLRDGLASEKGIRVGVVVSDTLGRPWRLGLSDVAIGVAGIAPLVDHRGRADSHGHVLDQTIVATADEIAAAADLVKGKLDRIPVAVVRGLDHLVTDDDGPGAGALVRPADMDMFRLGHREVVPARRTVRTFSDRPVERDVVMLAVASAVTAPAPHHTTPWRFVLVEDPSVRSELLDAMAARWADDLAADGFDQSSIQRRLRRGDILRYAPALVVPCLVRDGSHPYPDEQRANAEREMFLVAMGAGVENFLVALAAEGIGSAWVSSTLFCKDVAAQVLELPAGWEPMGAVAVGYPDRPSTPRPDRDAADFAIVR